MFGFTEETNVCYELCFHDSDMKQKQISCKIWRLHSDGNSCSGLLYYYKFISAPFHINAAKNSR